MAIERTDADLMHLERRITALEDRSRNILLRLHDKIVGYCTVFGTVVGIGPSIADYFGQVDWKSFGLAPLTALALVFGLLSGLSAKLIAAAVCLAFAFTGGAVGGPTF